MQVSTRPSLPHNCIMQACAAPQQWCCSICRSKQDLAGRQQTVSGQCSATDGSQQAHQGLYLLQQEGHVGPQVADADRP